MDDIVLRLDAEDAQGDFEDECGDQYAVGTSGESKCPLSQAVGMFSWLDVLILIHGGHVRILGRRVR